MMGPLGIFFEIDINKKVFRGLLCENFTVLKHTIHPKTYISMQLMKTFTKYMVYSLPKRCSFSFCGEFLKFCIMAL